MIDRDQARKIKIKTNDDLLNSIDFLNEINEKITDIRFQIDVRGQQKDKKNSQWKIDASYALKENSIIRNILTDKIKTFRRDEQENRRNENIQKKQKAEKRSLFLGKMHRDKLTELMGKEVAISFFKDCENEYDNDQGCNL